MHELAQASMRNDQRETELGLGGSTIYSDLTPVIPEPEWSISLESSRIQYFVVFSLTRIFVRRRSEIKCIYKRRILCKFIFGGKLKVATCMQLLYSLKATSACNHSWKCSVL